mgnify:CR=1 FL=1
MKKIIAVILSMMMILPFCLAFGANAATPSVIYIDDINTYGSNQTGPALLYGEGKTAGDLGYSGHDWWDKVVVKFNAETGAFDVVASYPAVGGDMNYLNYTLGANEVMLLTFEWDGFGFGSIIENLAIGDKVYLYNFDFTNAAAGDQLSGGTSNVFFTTYEPSMGNGYYGYVAPPEPNIKNIGAKVNTELAGIRFGTTFKNDVTLGEVISLGTLLIPEAKLGSAELTLDSANDLIANVPARTIAAEDYVAGKAFEDYESFTYYVTIIGLQGHESDNIVARSYVTYNANTGVNTVYADAITRNINEVAAAAANN